MDAEINIMGNIQVNQQMMTYALCFDSSPGILHGLDQDRRADLDVAPAAQQP